MNKAMKMIMERIGEILADTNAHTFTITGYCHLETKLILHYHDCDEVYIFRYEDKDNFTLKERYWGKDRNFVTQSNEFSERHKNDGVERDLVHSPLN